MRTTQWWKSQSPEGSAYHCNPGRRERKHHRLPVSITRRLFLSLQPSAALPCPAPASRSQSPEGSSYHCNGGGSDACVAVGVSQSPEGSSYHCNHGTGTGVGAFSNVSITRRLFLSLQQVATIPKFHDFLRQNRPKITQTYFLLKNPGGLRNFRS